MSPELLFCLAVDRMNTSDHTWCLGAAKQSQLENMTSNTAIQMYRDGRAFVYSCSVAKGA